jgi:hypothetical protein
MRWNSRCGDSKREGSSGSHETDNSRTIESGLDDQSRLIELGFRQIRRVFAPYSCATPR